MADERGWDSWGARRLAAAGNADQTRDEGSVRAAEIKDRVGLEQSTRTN